MEIPDEMLKEIREKLIDVILIGKWLLSIEGIYTRALAESSLPSPCNLWNSWINSFVGNL